MVRIHVYTHNEVLQPSSIILAPCVCGSDYVVLLALTQSLRSPREEQSCEAEPNGEKLPHLLLSGGWAFTGGERWVM